MIAMALSAPWGCGGSSEDDEGDGSGSGAYCSRAITKFNGCGMGGLLGEELSCNEPDSADERCSADCILRASCGDLRNAICLVGTSPSLGTCLGSCEPPPVTCPNGETFSSDYRCDSYPDCSDGSDERDCPTFTCGSGETVPESYECDFGTDCADGSDEHSGCSNVFVCNDGYRISSDWECDGYADCIDGSDEHAGCPPVVTVTCADGEVVPGERCDGYEDCFDGSDEPDSCPPTPREEICGPE